MKQAAGQVRPFTTADVEAVAEVHRQAFRLSSEPSEELLATYNASFVNVFLDRPLLDTGDIRSLVYEQSDGEFVGFLGVVPQAMRVHEKAAIGAVATNFCVRRDSGAHLVAVRLLKAFLHGPQDFSFADEAGDKSRAIWQYLGGSTAHMCSVPWLRPLRPTQLALFSLSSSGRFRRLAGVAKPAALFADAVLTRLPRYSPRWSPVSLDVTPANTDELLEHFRTLTRKSHIRPHYERATLAWTLERLRKQAWYGEFRSMAVRDQRHGLVGVYGYYANPGGIGEVLFLVAKERHTSDVFHHLCHAAWREGTLAVHGHLDPSLIRAVSQAHCLHLGLEWTLVHSSNPHIMSALRRGDMALTRLDGEFPLHLGQGESI